jgi:predicted HNH restriction endonuclease
MRWNKEEVEYLKKTYPTEVSIGEISNKLKKSIKSIHHKAVRLSLSRLKIPTNRPKNKNHRNEYDKKYFLKNKENIYKNRKKRMRLNKINLIKKLGGKCGVCGYDKCPAAFDFHHNIKGKENNISVLLKNASKEKLLKEIKRCILLCSNCHRELHYKGS